MFFKFADRDLQTERFQDNITPQLKELEGLIRGVDDYLAEIHGELDHDHDAIGAALGLWKPDRREYGPPDDEDDED